jgi:hypothetical protein
MVEVAAEKNSTLVLPFPVEMLRYFEAVASGTPAVPRAEVLPHAVNAEGPSDGATDGPTDGGTNGAILRERETP